VVSAVVSVLPCVVVTNAFLCYVQALAGYPAIDWTRMVYDGSRALFFRGKNPTRHHAIPGARLSGYLVPSQLPDLPHNCRVSSFLCRIKCFFDYQADGASRALRSGISLPLVGYQGNLTDGASVRARVVYLQARVVVYKLHKLGDASVISWK
jgi:hypothetical protein